VQFEHAVHDLDVSAGKHDDRYQQKPDEAVR